VDCGSSVFRLDGLIARDQEEAGEPVYQWESWHKLNAVMGGLTGCQDFPKRQQFLRGLVSRPQEGNDGAKFFRVVAGILPAV